LKSTLSLPHACRPGTAAAGLDAEAASALELCCMWQRVKLHLVTVTVTPNTCSITTADYCELQWQRMGNPQMCCCLVTCCWLCTQHVGSLFRACAAFLLAHLLLLFYGAMYCP
jgi:hypothetical protein